MALRPHLLPHAAAPKARTFPRPSPRAVHSLRVASSCSPHRPRPSASRRSVSLISPTPTRARLLELLELLLLGSDGWCLTLIGLPGDFEGGTYGEFMEFVME